MCCWQFFLSFFHLYSHYSFKTDGFCLIISNGAFDILLLEMRVIHKSLNDAESLLFFVQLLMRVIHK